MHQHRVDHAEYSRGRSNPERQRDDCSQRESWTFDELPCGITQILKQGVHGSPRD